MYIDECTLILAVFSLVPLGTAAAHRFPNPSNSSDVVPLDLHIFNETLRPSPYKDDVQIGCKELRSKKYISDGFCTSIKPVTEMVCAGYCLPVRELPWYAEFVKYWSSKKLLEWRCVEERLRRRRVRLLCKDGIVKTYRIKVVRSCKCKRYSVSQNRPGAGDGSRRLKKRKKKRTKRPRANSRKKNRTKRPRKINRKKNSTKRRDKLQN